MSRDLDDEASKVTALLVGKEVRQVWRHRASEVGIEFADGTRLFIDAPAGDAVELSVTEGRPPE